MEAFVAWTILLFALLTLCLLPLFLGGVDLNKLSASSSLPAVAILAVVGILISAYTPTLAAVVVARFWPGAGGLRPLLRQAFRRRAHPGWYVLALLGPFPLMLAAVGIYAIASGRVTQLQLSLSSGLGFFAGSLIAGSIGEEFGWRGFALPRLQGRYGALWASILIGLLWSAWHLWPVVAAGGTSSSTWSDVASTFLRLISTSVIYTWMYNSTEGSLLLIMLAHAGHNIASAVVQVPAGGGTVVPVTVALLYFAVAIAVILRTNPGTLATSPNRASEAIGGTDSA